MFACDPSKGTSCCVHKVCGDERVVVEGLVASALAFGGRRRFAMTSGNPMRHSTHVCLFSLVGRATAQ